MSCWVDSNPISVGALCPLPVRGFLSLYQHGGPLIKACLDRQRRVLVPQLVREMLPTAIIRYFMHVTFLRLKVSDVFRFAGGDRNEAGERKRGEMTGTLPSGGGQ